MNKKVVILIVLIVGSLAFFASRVTNNFTSTKFNWKETYADRKRDVYGTYIMKSFLDKTSDNGLSQIGRKLSKYFDAENDIKGNYIFVGEALSLDDSDAKALADYVAKGNQAIISLKVFPHTLSSIIFESCRENIEQENYDEVQEDYYEDEYAEQENVEDEFTVEEQAVMEEYLDTEPTVYQDSLMAAQARIDSIANAATEAMNYYEYQRELWRNNDFDYLDLSYQYYASVNLSMDSLQVDKVVSDTIYKTYKNGSPNSRQWHYLHDSIACIEINEINVLGYINDSLINFFEIPYENGSFFIHTTPIAFTNTNMLNDQSTEYLSHVLSHCSQEEWHWDEYSRIDKSRGIRRNGGSRTISNKGPLTYILQQPPLAWAWYSTLMMGLLFLVFKAKRKQRVIPVLEENENTSLAFINTIGSLYFRKNDHKQLCIDQMSLWLEDIRQKYRLNTSELDEDFIKKLAAKSSISQDKIKSIIDYYNNINNSNFVSENTMIGFYQILNQFSEQAK